MPLLAAVAVTLSTATVLVVWSVMGGFLVNLIENGRTLTGDVKIDWSPSGFAYYEDLIERLEREEAVGAAAGGIETGGMLSLPDGRSVTVAIRGVHALAFARVTGLDDAWWWRPMDKPLPKDRDGEDPRLEEGNRAALEQILADGRRLKEFDVDKNEMVSALALGIEVAGRNIRTEQGFYFPTDAMVAGPGGGIDVVDGFMPAVDVVLGVPVFDRQGRPFEFRNRPFPVANEFMTGMYAVDKASVLIDLPALQRMMNMHETVQVSEESAFETTIGEDDEEVFPVPVVTGTNPRRVTTVYVRAAEGFDANQLKEVCVQVYAEFAAAHPGEVPSEMSISISTWEEQHALFIGAVKKEIVLVMFIFGIVSLTSVFLVLAIFWAMVSEKTKDIGVLRALWASQGGIAWLWLRYGLAIGIVGSALGGTLAWLIVTNINGIHDGLIRLGQIFEQNWAVWDPKVYVFTEIPNDLEPWKAIIIMSGGILASVLGTLWPAIRAARMDPVKSLRFE